MDPSTVILVDLILLMISGMVEVIRTDTTTLAVLRRVRRQIPRNIKQGCTTTGYEKRVRELCEEVLETICTVSSGACKYRIFFSSLFKIS